MTVPADSGPGEPGSAPRSAYGERLRRHESAVRTLGRLSRTVSNLRGLAFAALLVSGIAPLMGVSGTAWPVLGAVSFVAFVGLVAYHAAVIRREDHARRLRRVNRDALSRLEGDWDKLEDDGSRFRDDSHPYAEDLDLFGKGSLYQRLSVARTHFGQEAMARFLREAAAPDVIEKRQGAARALAPRLDERQELEALAMSASDVSGGEVDRARGKAKVAAPPPDPEALLAWAEGAPRLRPRLGLVLLAHVLPPSTVALAAAASAFHWPAATWAAPLIAQIAIVVATRSEIDRVFAAVSATQGAFLRYGPMFELVERFEGSSALLDELRSGLVGGSVRPSAAMRRFERIVGWFELRHNGLVHPFINALLLWDVHCVLRLEAWQDAAGRGARGWFRTLGEVEAISGFAALAFDEPLYAWPDVREGPAHFEADGLGHPLLPSRSRSSNDVALREAGRALLITGSNMSGKSTLLRSMGVAAVLAQAGAPICAVRLRMSPLAVRTSLKISDSLTRGVSHFYAEVARLKAVLDATAGSTPVFFLLDEVLHGTNSRERQIGARWVLAELLHRGALGAVSTHDAGLCQLPPELMERVDQFHFRESIEDGKMSFDYRLRPGPVQGGNALRLMRLVGLAVPLASDDDPLE